MSKKERKKQHEKLKEEVVRRILKGDENAICKLVAHYQNLAMSICKNRGIQFCADLNDAEVEDIVQKAMIKLITKRLREFTKVD